MKRYREVCAALRECAARNGKEATEALVFSVTGKRFVEHYHTQHFDKIIAAATCDNLVVFSSVAPRARQIRKLKRHSAA